MVSINNGNVRLLDFLIQYVDTIQSRNQAKKALKLGSILVDGIPGKSGWMLKPGQLVEHYKQAVTQQKIFNIILEILFEDDYLAVINKPAGIGVSGNYFRTIQNALEGNLKPSLQSDAIVPRPAHRLDNQTSGLLVIAKTQTALINLGEQFANKIIRKQYHAIVIGVPKPAIGEISLKIEHKEACTKYEVIASVDSLKYKKLSLVKLKPLTGRTHQLRIHLSQINHSILGDKIYSPKELIFKGKGLFLCSTSIKFAHPALGKVIDMNIKVPNKFESLLKREQSRWNYLPGNKEKSN